MPAIYMVKGKRPKHSCAVVDRINVVGVRNFLTPLLHPAKSSGPATGCSSYRCRVPVARLEYTTISDAESANAPIIIAFSLFIARAPLSLPSATGSRDYIGSSSRGARRDGWLAPAKALRLLGTAANERGLAYGNGTLSNEPERRNIHQAT